MNKPNNVVINTTEENEVFVESTSISKDEFVANQYEETHNEKYMEDLSLVSAVQGLL